MDFYLTKEILQDDFGLLEYKSNSNDNADHIPEDMKFKFVDDLNIQSHYSWPELIEFFLLL